MRKIGFILITVLLLFCCGCARQAEEVDVLDVDDAAASKSDTAASPKAGGGLKAVATVAYVFENEGRLWLYGAVEYENEGEEPLYLSSATFSFKGEKSVSYELEPLLAQYNVLSFGERAYCAAWFSADDFESGDALTLEAALSASPGDLSSSVRLEIRDVFLADNYPGFTTMTGTLVNDEAQSCSLNMNYVGFYDANGAFLGAWYFSQNAQLDKGDSVRFTTHLKAFPVNKLAEKGVRSECRAFGFN